MPLSDGTDNTCSRFDITQRDERTEMMITISGCGCWCMLTCTNSLSSYHSEIGNQNLYIKSHAEGCYDWFLLECGY